MFREPFAAGHVFSMSMLDTLLYQVMIYFNQYTQKTIFDIIHQTEETLFHWDIQTLRTELKI